MDDSRIAIEYRPTASLIPYAANSRTHSDAQVETLVKSIQEFGFTNPVLIGDDDVIVAGHGRVMAASKLGMEELPTVRLSHLTPDQRRAYVIADNQIALQSGWNEELLTAELTALGDADVDLSSLGFDASELDKMLATEPETPVDDPPTVDSGAELQAKWKTERGQLWLIQSGDLTHRLLCGDARLSSDVAKVMNSADIRVDATSPPYAQQRDYDTDSEFVAVSATDYVAWFRPVADNVRANLADGGSWFVNIKPHCEDGQRSLYVLDLVSAHVRDWGWRLVDEFAWTHEGTPGKWSTRLKNQFEPIYHFAVGRPLVQHSAIEHNSDRATLTNISNVSSTGNVGAIGDAAPGMALPGNVLRIKHGEGRDDSVKHPAKYPIELPSFFLRAFAQSGESIFDPFAGGGTTFVAADRLGCVGHGVEISPKYVAMILERMTRAGCECRLEGATDG